MFAFVFNAQLVFDGAVTGLGYGILAAGLVLVFRSSGIINFAHAEVGAFSVALLALLVIQYHWPYAVAAPLVILVGAVLSAIIEMTVIRRLHDAPRVIVLIATVGVAQVLLFATIVLPDVEGFHRYPMLFGGRWEIGPLLVRSDQLIALVAVPLTIGLLGVFLDRTFVGTAIRGAAANVEATRLMGINARLLSTLVWALAGALSAITALVVRPVSGAAVITGRPVLDARLLVVALTAALVARFRSLPVTVLAGLVIGIVERVMLVNRPAEPGLITAVTLVVVLVLSMRVTGSGDEGRSRWSFAAKRAPLDPRAAEMWIGRHLPQVTIAVVTAVAIVLPLVVTKPSRQQLYAKVVIYALLALSVTVLTGWAGQVSLGQFSFAGLGAFVTAAAMRHGSTFGLAIVAAAAVVTIVAVALGIPSVRVRGLMLAVATLAFAVFTSGWLLDQEFLSGGQSSIRIPRTIENGLDFGPQRTYYWLCLVVLGLVAWTASRMRRRGIGRRLIAVRDNENAAAAMTVSPRAAKLLAFGVGGTIAGLAGALYGGLVGRLDHASFPPELSIDIVAIAVIGGLGSVAGAVLGAVWVVGLPVILGDSPEVRLVTSGVGLLVLLMYFPGGLIDLAYRSGDALLGRLAARRPQPAPKPRPPVPSTLSSARPQPPPGVPALRTEGITVTFGGNRAVDGMSIEVGRGEIVGLIGANGAGKTTLMNAIGGFVPSTGRVWLFGEELTGRPPAKRAIAGLGRAFQNAELFPELTVRETVQVALEREQRTRLWNTVIPTPGGARRERAQRARADELIGFLGLGRYANAVIGNLSTGTRRITELACLLALDAAVLCLDEPTAGVAQKETEAFGPLLREIRTTFDCSMLLIEHDMPLVLSISDRVYCMELGRQIAHGTPAEVRDDPAVVASYLGTDEKAILRSGPG